MTSENQLWEGWVKLTTSKRARHSGPSGEFLFGDEYRTQQRLQHRIDDETKVLDRLRESHPSLYRGDCGIVLSDEDVAQLQKEVVEDVGGYSLRNRHNFLVRGLALGCKELQWQVNVPDPINVDLAEPSLLSPESFADGKDGRLLYDAYRVDLRANTGAKTLESQRREAGQLLFSCLMDSACLSRFWFDVLPESIRRGVSVHGKLAWLELGQELERHATDSRDRRRRFFPAPLTQLLLQRWYERWHHDWPKEAINQRYVSAKTLLLEYTDTLSKPLGLPKACRVRLVSMAETEAAKLIPGTLIHYLRSADLGVPITEENWLRLVSGKRIKSAGHFEDNRTSEIPDKALAITSMDPGVDCPDQLQLLYRIKRTINKKRAGTKKPLEKSKILVALKAFTQANILTPVLQLLSAWAYALVDSGGINGKGLRPASVVRYLDWIGTPLVVQSGALMSPESMDSDDWQAIYDNCLASAIGKTGDVAGRLLEFHEFIRVNYGAPAVELDGVAGQRQVDASVLTPREYDTAKRMLRQSRKGDLSEVLELVLILGYRCGLRRGEAWSRLVKDFDGFENSVVSRVELLVRPNKWSGIKSWSGTRRLPLWLLLDEQEMALLESFYRRRKDRMVGSGTNQALFAQDMTSGAPFDEGEVFGVITDTLKSVSGDNRIRFHHLRHSFVSFTFLRLMETERQKHLPAQWVSGDQSQALLPVGVTPLARQISSTDSFSPLGQISMWAGHASPQETCRSYSHLLDWLVRSYLWKRRNPKLPIEEQAALLGKSEEAVEKRRQREKVKEQFFAEDVCGLFIGQWRKTTLRKLPVLMDNLPDEAFDQTTPQVPASPKERLMAAYELAYQAEELVFDLSGQHYPRGLEAAADKLKVPLETALRWMNNAKILMETRSSRKRRLTAEKASSGPIAPRSRLSTGTDDVRRSLDQKDTSRGLPELRNFIAPPRTPLSRRYAAFWYEKLLEWEERESKAAKQAMLIVLQHAQRTRARVKVRAINKQVQFAELLKVLGLTAQLKLEVRILPGVDKKKIRSYWANRFGLSASAVSFNQVSDPETRYGEYGRPHLLVSELKHLIKFSEGEDGEEQNRKTHDAFWESLRFVTMSALVVTGNLRKQVDGRNKEEIVELKLRE